MAEQLQVVSVDEGQGQTAEETVDGPTMKRIQEKLFGWELPEGDVEILKKPSGRPIVLGEGGYGKVFKGSLWRGQFTVAVKEFNQPRTASKDREKMGQEMQILSNMHSPYVTQFIGVCFKPKLRMVMEFLEGGSLYDAIGDDELGLFTWYKRGSKIALEIAQGLFALHKRKVIHFDIKSPNILLSAELSAKICDVGIAKQATKTQTRAGDGDGYTFQWAAPEQINGVLCSTRADIYAYGVVLWEIVTGDRPHRGQMFPAKIPEQCPQEVWDLIERCLKPNPDERLDAEDIVDLLKGLDAKGPPKPPPAYLCPLTSELMTDPVRLVSTGAVYERANIKKWFAPNSGKQRRFCPQTGLSVKEIRLIPQADLLESIKSWQEMSKASGPRTPPRPPSAHLLPPTPPANAAQLPRPPSPQRSPPPSFKSSQPSAMSDAVAPEPSKSAVQGASALNPAQGTAARRAGSGVGSTQQAIPAAHARSPADPAAAAAAAAAQSAVPAARAGPVSAQEAPAAARQLDAPLHYPGALQSGASPAVDRQDLLPPHPQQGSTRAASLRTPSPPKLPTVYAKASETSIATESVRTGVSQASSGSFTGWLPKNSSQSTQQSGLGASASQAAALSGPSHEEAPALDGADVPRHEAAAIRPALGSSEPTDLNKPMRRSVSPRVVGLQAGQLSGDSVDSSRIELQPHESWLREAASSAGSHSSLSPIGLAAQGSSGLARLGLASDISNIASEPQRRSTESQRSSLAGDGPEFKFPRSDAMPRHVVEAAMENVQAVQAPENQSASGAVGSVALSNHRRPSPVRLLVPQGFTTPSPFELEQVSPASFRAQSPVSQGRSGLSLRASQGLQARRSTPQSISEDDVEVILKEICSSHQGGPILVAPAVRPSVPSPKPSSSPSAEPDQKPGIRMRRPENRRHPSPEPRGLRPRGRPGRESSSSHAGPELSRGDAGSTPQGQANAALDELPGKYSHPRRLSKSRGMSQQGSGGIPGSARSERGEPEAPQQYEDAFASSREPTSPFERDNSFAQQGGEFSSLPQDETIHGRSTSQGSLEQGGQAIVRLNAMGGKRAVFGGEFAAGHWPSGSPQHSPQRQRSARLHHPTEASHQLHDAVSADQSATSDTSRLHKGGSRVTTPKDSRESQASYNTMQSTDPSSSDVEDSASTHQHLDGGRHFSLETGYDSQHADNAFAAHQRNTHAELHDASHSLPTGVSRQRLQSDFSKASVGTQRGSEDSCTLGPVCEQAIRETTAERSCDAQLTPSGPASKALQAYIDMLRRLSGSKLDVRREAATEVARGAEASLTVLAHLVEAICELYPGQTRRADLDHAGLMAACKSAAELGEGDVPRRSSSGLKKWGGGRSKHRLDAGGGQSRPAEAIPACAQCLVQLLRVGDAPSALAALLMAVLAADNPNWATTFISAGCLVPLATMLGGPSEQEAACHALMSLAESSTDNKEQAKAIIATVQRNLIWALQPQPGARPGTAQVHAARTIALLAQDNDCASILGRDCLPPLIKLLKASDHKLTCQEAVVQALNRLLRGNTAALAAKLAEVDCMPPLVHLLKKAASFCDASWLQIQIHTAGAISSIVHNDAELCCQAIQAGVLNCIEFLLRHPSSIVQMHAARLLDHLAHGKDHCRAALHDCAVQCLPVLRPMMEGTPANEDAEKAADAANAAVLHLAKIKAISSEDLEHFKIQTHIFGPATRKFWSVFKHKK